MTADATRLKYILIDLRISDSRRRIGKNRRKSWILALILLFHVHSAGRNQSNERGHECEFLYGFFKSGLFHFNPSQV